jgi:ketosteroid isomerase-like protein
MSITTAAGAQRASAASRAVDELLAADRAFSAASAKTDLVTGISAMFADDVLMPIPRNGFAEGKAKAIETLRSNPDNPKSKATWTPIRGGISADGLHGFTYGYMTTEKADKTTVPGKYLAYWVKGPKGWRVAVYKRAGRPAGEVAMELRAPSLPAAMVKPSKDQASIERFRHSVDSVERAFSDEAQKTTLGAAFFRNGAPDAMNMGGEPAFSFGPEAISKGVSEGGPATGSPVSWAPDKKVIVASSGDLGVSIGTIWPNDPPPAGQVSPRFPFFTIWRRASPNGPWLYVAE